MPFVPVSFEPEETFDGWITAVYDTGEFGVQMTDSRGEECVARLVAGVIPDEMLEDAVEGALFELKIGFHKDRFGTVRRGHEFKLKYDERTPEEFEADRKRAEERAKELCEAFGIRWEK